MKGRRSETIALCYLKERGVREIYHDVTCVGVQIDLLVRSRRGGWVIVEVKSQSTLGLAQISWRQKARLYRVACILGELGPVEVWLATVDRAGRTRLFPVESF